MHLDFTDLRKGNKYETKQLDTGEHNEREEVDGILALRRRLLRLLFHEMKMEENEQKINQS